MAKATGGASALRIPITNVFDGSAYSAKVTIGSAGTVANLLLDTGSSSLAVESSVYDGTGDTRLASTGLAQLITYGGGGWGGPVVTTDLSFGGCGIVLEGASIAIAAVQQGSLGQVAGVLGLAFGGANPAYDFRPYLEGKGTTGSTWPWPFGTGNLGQLEAELSSIVQSNGIRQTQVTPVFDQLVSEGLVANKFAFQVLRSSLSLRLGDTRQAQAADPLNNGVFVLGGGEEQSDLFEGDFVTAAVVHDLFYNLNLKSIRVGRGASIAAAPLQTQYQSTLVSNAIIDSGNQWLSLASEIHEVVLSQLGGLNPAFAKVVNTNQPVAAATLDLAAWPTLYFTLSGPSGEDVELSVAPSTYWQVDYPAVGQATFKISGPLYETANQSNLGLPLMNNHYTVFDRSQSGPGVVRFAPIKPPAGQS